MVLSFIARLLATFFILAPVTAFAMLFIDPLMAWTIFLAWTAVSGSLVGLAFIVLSLVYIWRDMFE